MTSLFELYYAKRHDFSPGEIMLCLPVTKVTVYLDPMKLSNFVRNPTRPPQTHQEHPLLDRLFGGI